MKDGDGGGESPCGVAGSGCVQVLVDPGALPVRGFGDGEIPLGHVHGDARRLRVELGIGQIALHRGVVRIGVEYQ
ncbi:hypothetical protein [Actinomyces ruminicola]|uniref:hypothetical protein n=1 Tax=Actinomyces ruminicola TaxID=332524 RepID=UPI00115F849D|nr:hypothetical protein [Actinomyces ruminicola]